MQVFYNFNETGIGHFHDIVGGSGIARTNFKHNRIAIGIQIPLRFSIVSQTRRYYGFSYNLIAHRIIPCKVPCKYFRGPIRNNLTKQASELGKVLRDSLT